MPLSWNEIRHKAIQFSKEWAGETREHAEAKSFWDEFFAVFGLRRRQVASFEEPVKRITGDYGYIDLFWPGTLIVEHKSAGKDLSQAESQAFRYIQDLARDPERQKDIPRYIIVSDFNRIALHDLEPEERRDLPLFDKRRIATVEFTLADFHRHIQSFAFIPGYKQHTFTEQDPINLKAVELLGLLHDALEAGGYAGPDLERFLVRILFCLFAEDTALFERESFKLYIENRTASDGSDLGARLAQLFQVLNTQLKNVSSISMTNSNVFHTSTANSSPNNSPLPTSTRTCAMRSLPVLVSAGLKFLPPSSVRSSKASWNRANAARSARTTPANAISSKSSALSSSTISRPNSKNVKPIVRLAA